VKKAFVLAVACSTLFLCATLSVVASGKYKINYEFSPDGKTVRVTNPPASVVPGPEPEASSKTIFSNFSHYKLATYFSIWGETIAQGGQNYPFQTWQAVAFTPTANATATKIEVSASRQGGGNAGFEVGLYADNNGVPGSVLQSVHVSNLSQYGQCCEVATANLSPGVAVTAGTQYWVAVTTTADDTDIYAWAFNSTNMTAQPAAGWCYGSEEYCGSDSGIWVAYSYVQLGFAVLGQ